jgi:hypothetical protein
MKTKSIFILLLSVILIGAIISVVLVVHFKTAPLPDKDAPSSSLPARSALEDTNIVVAQQQSRNNAVAALLKSDPDADFIVMGDYVCVNTSDEMSLEALNLSECEQIGRIERRGKQVDWEMWDASTLKIGTRVLRHPARNDILIVVQGEKMIPYKQRSE